jgi:hypothetical protein
MASWLNFQTGKHWLGPALMAVVGVLMFTSMSSASVDITFRAVADAHVSAQYPTQNYGTSKNLRLDGDPITNTYLRFDVKGASDIAKATLRLYNASASNSGYEVMSVSSVTWSETGLTYNNAPAYGALLGSSGATKTGTWTELDVTSVVKANGSYSFALARRSTTSATLMSREGSVSTAPQLVLSGTTPQATLPPGTLTPMPTPSSDPSIRAAFYYPWFPQAWNQGGVYPYTNYLPSPGYYNSSDLTTVKNQIKAMQYGKISAGISSWWGQGHHTDDRVATLLSAATGSGFLWTLYYEEEAYGDPTVDQIAADLSYIRDKYAASPSFLKIDGRFVVFVYADGTDSCDMVDRWNRANTVNAYVVLKVFSGYRLCSSQPQGWHQYNPAQAADSQGANSYSISPGFWQKNQSPRLERDLARWQQSIRAMVNSGAQFQLVTTFNEWGEGTSVESAATWASTTGYGAYLDALHSDGNATGIGSTPTATATPPITSTPIITGEAAVLLAAGDIASCSSSGDEATAALLDGLPGTIATLGDNAYESGSKTEFTNCFSPSWGKFVSRIRPAPGNHEYQTSGAAGYYDYFGRAAGDPAKGYYSYELGSWHVVVLNSNCSKVGGCGAGSAQEKWLRADLAAHPNSCKLAYFHHPLFSSGEHGNNTAIAPLWRALMDYRTTVVLSGHDHDYERFAPQDANGAATPSGIRQFIVGTGGKSHYPITSVRQNSQVHNDTTYGVLKLTLNPSAYAWEFIPVDGGSFVDVGAESCKK